MTIRSDTAVLGLPRHAWQDHPRFPQQVLLLDAHKRFRLISRSLARRAESGGDAAAIGRVFDHWKSAMSSHERYEEHKLYPYLEARWGLSCEPLRAGHHQLAALDAAVRAAAAGCDGPATPALCTALRTHDAALHAHLDVEEDRVVPALLALQPDEFESYYHSNIHTLLSRLGQGE